MIENRSDAYRTIGKHLFAAYRRYSEDFNPVIILADNLEDAKKRAKEYFDTCFFAVAPLRQSHIGQVYEIEEGCAVKVRTYCVPVTWMMTGEYLIEAESAEEAAQKALGPMYPLPDMQDYVADSLEIDGKVEEVEG